MMTFLLAPKSPWNLLNHQKIILSKLNYLIVTALDLEVRNPKPLLLKSMRRLGGKNGNILKFKYSAVICYMKQNAFRAKLL